MLVHSLCRNTAPAPESVTNRASVIVVTYNHVGVINGCLEALTQTIGSDDEIVVVDNASSDGTPALIQNHHPTVRLIISPTNTGFGAACNRGARAALGTYLVFVNPDTQAREGWLDPLLEQLGEARAPVLVTAKLLLARQPQLVDTFGNDVHISGVTTSRHWREPAAEYTYPEQVCAVSGACFALHASLFARLGGFDERLFLYFEDTELSLRARLAGCRCVAVPQALLLHDHRPGFGASKLRYLERNRWWTLLKLCHFRTLLALTPVLVVAEILAWGMAIYYGPQHVIGKARSWFDLLRWLPELPGARAQVSALRVVSDRQIWLEHSTRLSLAQVGQTKAELAIELVFGLARWVAERVGVEDA